MTISVVIDTNVLVSAFVNPTGYPSELLRLARLGRIQIVTSTPLLEELYEVLCRPRIMKVRQTTTTEAKTFVHGVGAVSQFVSISGALKLCRDPDDDIVIETATEGNAAYVISRDADISRDLALLRELEQRGIQAVTVQRFLDIMQNVVDK